jgi:UDP-glucose 4-epimerase
MLLRYFNPVGAHASGLISEDPGGIPNNLMPFVAQVAVGRRFRLRIFEAVPNGRRNWVRDYIHVVDLAQGHVAAALKKLGDPNAQRQMVVNLGTGRGHSVLEVVRSFEAASRKTIPYDIVARRREMWPFALPMSAGQVARLESAARPLAVRRRVAMASGEPRRFRRASLT